MSETTVRSLRLKKELWERLKECAEMADSNVNAFCANVLNAMCDSILETATECDNGKETDK